MPFTAGFAGSFVLPGLAACGFSKNIEAAGFDVFSHRPTLAAADAPVSCLACASRGGRAVFDADMARDTNFYYSFLVLPPDKRRAIVAVWDFCRAVDDAVDEAERVSPPGCRSRRWRTELAAVFEGGHAADVAGTHARAVRAAFNLPRLGVRRADRRRRNGSRFAPL